MFEKIRELASDPEFYEDMEDPELWSDIACVALNNLPPRYVRHSVDMTFYLSTEEHIEMDERVSQAVRNAITFVLDRSSKAG